MDVQDELLTGPYDGDYDDPDIFDDVPLPGTGHPYSDPFSIGDVKVYTLGDFLANTQELYEAFMEIYDGEDGEDTWALYAADLQDTYDTDKMDEASFQMMIMTSSPGPMLPKVQTVLAATAPTVSIQDMLSDEAEAELAAAIEALTFDVFEKPEKSAKVNKPEPGLNSKATGHTISRNFPPLAPIKTTSAPCALRISSIQYPINLVKRMTWAEVVRENVTDFPSMFADTELDAPTLMSMSTCRSNSRMEKNGSVMLVYSDGDMVNVGSHGWNVTSDVDIPMDIGEAKLALQELFAAPGGECLTNPTPSHILHQMVSAILSNAVRAESVLVEHDNIDVGIHMQAGCPIPHIPIDITSSAGIWNKKLTKDKKNPNYRTQAAISKYDFSAAILYHLDEDSRNILVKAVANSLACEYPSVWKKQETDDVLEEDLVLQSAIHDQMAKTSHRKIKELGEMCYQAAIEESLYHIPDTPVQGMPWKEKRDILRKGVEEIFSDNDIAFPPLPLTEILPLPSKSFSFSLLGHQFVTSPYIITGRTEGPRHDMDNIAQFLEYYPANGIITQSDARDLAELLDENPLTARGLTHQGPASEYKGNCTEICTAANLIYSRSAGAQLAEIRSDVARAIYKLPMPGKNKWHQTYIYKGKVAMWWRCRDNPSSPDGYRIDWFAVSSFKVAGSVEIVTNDGEKLQLWPRQRIRSQELGHAHMGPRRLKSVLVSMLEKTKAAQTDYSVVMKAWERLVLTNNSSTYASGELYLTSRYLSSSLASPASPFHEMKKKLVKPKTFACIFYLTRLHAALFHWNVRNQYRGTCPLLGLPRSFGQLESYWMMWVPSEFADTQKNMMRCVIGLQEEAQLIKDTMTIRVKDLTAQYNLLQQSDITTEDLRTSLRETCMLDTGGKLGWTWIGSLAAGHALHVVSDASNFDRKYGKGTKARNISDHLTVRHSARIDKNNKIVKGTVAEMIVETGLDPFLSTIDNTFRFLFVNRPVFFNHPKKGEHKPREISITDPDTRIALSNAELICGKYGLTTQVDFLKDSQKNAKFYRNSSGLLRRGGGIQSSDATRYGPNMSNFAIAIMLLYLGSMSMHLLWASVVYARLAFREMLLPQDIRPSLDKYSQFDDMREKCIRTLHWMDKMPIRAYEDGMEQRGYITSHHMGQGMSHHSSSLLHAGGLLCACVAASRCIYTVSGKPVTFQISIMVTSDDSTILVEPQPINETYFLTRAERQIMARKFLEVVRSVRPIALRMVSVLANLVKEMISGVKGEFNSQDTGIGETCPILGFRELISLITEPSSPSLIGDYLNAHANARNIAFAGQGLTVGNFVHHILIDTIEERWSLTQAEKISLSNMDILPCQLTEGTTGENITSSPSSWLRPDVRAALYRLSVDKNKESEDVDPHTRDSIFSPMMHIKIGMPAQHRKAISVLKAYSAQLDRNGYALQAKIILQSLRSTVASARTRNMGRVAMRVRTRYISPRPYLKNVFQRDMLLNSTLDWCRFLEDHIQTKITNNQVSTEDIAFSSSLAGYINLVGKARFGFPHPPQQRTHKPKRYRKPVYIERPYGATPFGRHAIERSHSTVVDSFGPPQREAMQQYLAYMRHKKFFEHIEYGGSFVTDWSKFQAATIVALDISAQLPESMARAEVKWGSFSESSVRQLRMWQRTNDKPVLALHRYESGVGLWHCEYKGQAYSVSLSVDLDEYPGGLIAHRTETHEQVLLANQGFCDRMVYESTIPSAEDNIRYQDLPYDTDMPNTIKYVEDENVKSTSLHAASYATEVKVDGEDVIVYIVPEMTKGIRDDPALRNNLPFVRGKVVAKLSAGGYWHTAQKGVAFRAFMKGHFQDETIWMGGVLGWRLSASGVPKYYNSVVSAQGVETLIVLNGLDSPDNLTAYNPDIFSSGGHKVVSQSNTKTYSRAIRLYSSTMRNYILAANSGNRFHLQGTPKFLDMRYGPIRGYVPTMTQEEAREALIAEVLGAEYQDRNF